MEGHVKEWVALREKTLAKVRAILIEDLGINREPDEIDPDTPLFGTGLGLDSVDAVELIVSLETRTGIRLPAGKEELAAMRTVNALADIVIALGGQSDEPAR